jgi:translation initiation factor IF-2
VATTRVHTLAKELGVPSKTIIDKCRAEGIDLKNHMAAVSVGLAESIREWFSSTEDITSVEVAERVDVEGVRKTRRRPHEEQLESSDHEGDVAVEDDSAVATAPPVSEEETSTAAEIAPPPELAPEVEAEPEFVAIEPPPIIESPPPPEEVAVAVAPVVVEEPLPTESIAAVAPPKAPEPPPVKAPEPIRPAGPQVVPAPAELRGPKVVRIEAPEPERIPRPRPMGPRPPGTERAPAAATGVGTAPPRRGRGKATKAEEEEAARRLRSPRRHGATTDVDQRLREWRDQDLLERRERLASVTGHGLRDRRAAERRRAATNQSSNPEEAEHEPLVLTVPILLKDFCSLVGVGFGIVSKKLLEHTGRLWMINQMLDAEQTELIAMDLGLAIRTEKAKTAYERLEEEFDHREHNDLRPRPPVVAMLGHVDHGKTSLLDAIRKAHVAAGEAGGITQHIGAYRIDRGDWHVTFVDTPGHKAFTEMRARGANLTDVVVLVVAADDGVMPQTVEAIAHARAAEVPIVVALNKMDMPGIDLNRVFSQLAEHGLAPTEWGGDTDLIKTSATTGEGIDALVAHLSTLSELLDLKADPTVPVQATVIEARMQEGRGVAVQVLVREGTLRPGACVVCGPGAGRVRALRNDRGVTVTEAGPGTPVEISGLDAMPAAGDRLFVVDSLSIAKDMATEVLDRRRMAALDTTPKPRTLEALMRSEAQGELPELNVIVRADVQGSVEVLKMSLGELPATKARLKLLHAAVGAISEADVQLAKASGALIIGFHVVADASAGQLADQLGVEIRTYRVIYELLDDLRRALAGLLSPVEREEQRATLEVRQAFNVSRIGTVAGCLVTDGVINRNSKVRLVRDGRVIVDGRGIGSLRRFKDDVREVRAGMECGVRIQDFDDVKPGDVIQVYEVVEVAQDL